MPLYHGKKYIGNVNVKFEGINGVNTSDANIESGSQMLAGVTAYGKNGKITGTIPSQSAKTIIPNDDSQIAIQSGTYAKGAVTVSAVPTETKNITANGTYEPQDGKYFSSVSVNIPAEVFETQSKNVSPNESVQTITPDTEYDGLSSVVVDAIPTDYIGSGINREDSKTIIPNDNSQTAVSAGTYVSGDITVSAVPSETKNITANGTYTPENGKYFSSVSVNIVGDSFDTQTKSISPTESVQTVIPDNGYDGLSSVTIEAIPTNYVGSSIAREGAKSITPNDNSQVAISAETYVTGNVIVEAVPTETKNITENGIYTPTAGNYFSSVSVNIPEEVFETQSKTINPTESQQTVSPDANYDGLSSVVVNAIPSDYVGSGVNRQAAKTITPTKSVQTAIQAGSYAEGAITVEAIPSEYIITSDATATDADIAYGKTAYVNGEKVEGVLREISSDSTATLQTSSVDVAYGALRAISEPSSIDRIYRGGSKVELDIPMEDFGDATAADVVSGKTFTSTSGLKITGTHTCPASLDTSDATAIAADIMSGKTAYVNGEKITGTIPVVESGENYITHCNIEDAAAAYGEGYCGFPALNWEEDIILKKDSNIVILVPLGDFGTANAEDVVAGKTFFDGFNVTTGTHVCSGGTDTSDATAVAADIAQGKTAYINGGKVTGTMVVQSYYTSNVEPSASLGNDGDLCLVRAGE